MALLQLGTVLANALMHDAAQPTLLAAMHYAQTIEFVFRPCEQLVRSLFAQARTKEARAYALRRIAEDVDHDELLLSI